MALFDTSVLMTYILTGLIAVLVGFIFLLNRKPPRLPPGPLSLPLIGSALSLWGPDPRKAMLRLAQQYGDIFTLDLGGTRTVILASYDVIHEILANNGAASSGRPLNNLGIKILTENGKGKWNTLRWRHNGRDGVSNHQRLDCFSTVCSDDDQRKH